MLTGRCWLGSVPRKAGMERKDLLGLTAKFSSDRGQAIEKNAASDVRRARRSEIRANTNCLIAMNNAKRDSKRSLVCHDPTGRKTVRGRKLAHKAGVGIGLVTNMTIWGIILRRNIRISTMPGSTIVRRTR